MVNFKALRLATEPSPGELKTDVSDSPRRQVIHHAAIVNPNITRFRTHMTFKRGNDFTVGPRQTHIGNRRHRGIIDNIIITQTAQGQSNTAQIFSQGQILTLTRINFQPYSLTNTCDIFPVRGGMLIDPQDTNVLQHCFGGTAIDIFTNQPLKAR